MRSRHSPGRLAAYLYLGLSIALNAAALILFRAMVGAVSRGSQAITMDLLARAASSWLLWAGGASFIAGLYFWVQSLKTIPLSLAYPTSSVSYLVIAPIAWYLFGEPITVRRAIGMAIIIAGVALLYHRRGPAKP